MNGKIIDVFCGDGSDAIDLLIYIEIDGQCPDIPYEVRWFPQPGWCVGIDGAFLYKLFDLDQAAWQAWYESGNTDLEFVATPCGDMH